MYTNGNHSILNWILCQCVVYSLLQKVFGFRKIMKIITYVVTMVCVCICVYVCDASPLNTVPCVLKTEKQTDVILGVYMQDSSHYN